MTSLTKTNDTVAYNPRGWAGLPSNLAGSISEYLGAADTLSLTHTCKTLCKPVADKGWGSAKAERAWEIIFGDATHLGHPKIARLVYEYSPLDGPDLHSLYRRAYSLVRKSFDPSHLRMITGIGIRGIHDFICLPTLDPMVKQLSARRGNYFDSRQLLDVQGTRHPVMKFCHPIRSWTLVISMYQQQRERRSLKTYHLFSTGGTTFGNYQYVLLSETRLIGSPNRISAREEGSSGFGRDLNRLFDFEGAWRYYQPVLNFEDSQDPRLPFTSPDYAQDP